METRELAQIQVHKDLVIEFNILKEELRKTGYPIFGGNPIISQIVARVLKERRNGGKNNIKLELRKIKGVKKNEVFFV